LQRCSELLIQNRVSIGCGRKGQRDCMRRVNPGGQKKPGTKKSQNMQGDGLDKRSRHVALINQTLKSSQVTKLPKRF
ncbi:hypothetical protein, partial [Mesorhizobium sp. M2D.F.Ca.ET.206.01.1.1]|uniref:hypothetical protein n=1 Tax=Mesorhizobium sp. M2D.F.Ca.ET.206.01.1.1 TaxID=2563939 RepID=UPI001AED763D